MTTNAGARELSSGGLGFRNTAETKGTGKSAIERAFTPEFLNRLDARVAFNPLGMEVILNVVDKFINELNAQLAEKRVLVVLDAEAREWLARNGFDSRYGARPMARMIHEKIKQPVASEMLFGALTDGGTVKVGVKDGDLKVQVAVKSDDQPVEA